MYANFLANLLQVAMFRKVCSMIQGIPGITPDIDMSCPIYMVKVTSHDFVGQNNRQTRITVTVIKDDCGGTCMDARGSPYTDTQEIGGTNKNYFGNTCTDDLRSARTEVSTASTVVRRIMCLYIPTKSAAMHGVTSTGGSTVKTVVRGRTNAYDEYGRYKPIRDIGTDVVGKVWKGIRYADHNF